MDTAQLKNRGRDFMKEQSRNVGTNERRMSLAGGAAAALMGLSRGGLPGLALTALGAALVYRGATGHSAIYRQMGKSTARPDDPDLFGSTSSPSSTDLHATITINREAGDLYTAWHDFSRLPKFMRYIKEIRQAGSDRWHWVADLPMAGSLEWDSIVTADEPNERIAWRSVEGSDIDTEGEVRFRRHPGGRGTNVQVDMSYRAPGGTIGNAASKMMGLSKKMLQEDLRHFKQIMEAGEIPKGGATTEAMSSQRLQ